MNIYSDEFWDAQAEKITNVEDILRLPWEREEDSNYNDESIKELIASGYTVIEGNSAKILNIGLPNNEVIILSFSKLASQVLKKEETYMNREEFLDRCHWIYGECGGVKESIYYAFAIENLSKASGKVPGVTVFETEEELKKHAWRDNTHSFEAGNIKNASQPYKEFNKVRSLKSLENIKNKLNNNAYFRRTIKSVIWAHYKWQKDPTKGAYQWAGSQQAVIDYFSNKAFEPYDFVNISFNKSGGTFYQTFYKFRPR